MALWLVRVRGHDRIGLLVDAPDIAGARVEVRALRLNRDIDDVRPVPPMAAALLADPALPRRSALAAASHDGRHGAGCEECLLFVIGDVVGEAVNDLPDENEELPYCGKCGWSHEGLLDCQIPLRVQLAAIHRHGWEAALAALQATGAEQLRDALNELPANAAANAARQLGYTPAT